MKDFWKDYVGLCKETGRFYKKHWKGVIVLNAVIFGAECAYFKYQSKKFERYLSMNQEDEAQR